METLAQIPDDAVPTVDSDVRGYWRALAPLCWLLNALLNFQIILNSGRNLFTLSKGNATLELDIPAAVKAAGGGGARPPFTVVAPSDPGKSSTVYGRVNPESFFRPDLSSANTMAVAGLGEDFVLTPGTIGYLQVDTDDGYAIKEVGVVRGSGFGDDFIKITEEKWDQSFFTLWKVLAAPGGKPQHGGVIFTSGDGSTSVEVVSRCGSHMGAAPTVVGATYAMLVVMTSADD